MINLPLLLLLGSIVCTVSAIYNSNRKLRTAANILLSIAIGLAVAFGVGYGFGGLLGGNGPGAAGTLAGILVPILWFVTALREVLANNKRKQLPAQTSSPPHSNE